jgi:hypothetical protein
MASMLALPEDVHPTSTANKKGLAEIGKSFN